MKTSKLFLSAACSMMICLSSCSEDESFDPEPSAQTEWIEPCHAMGSTKADVAAYMALTMPEYELVNAADTATSSQLIYTVPSSSVGVLYSFDPIDGGLFSVIATVRQTNRTLVLEYLNSHYQVIDSNGSQDSYFTTSDRSVLITLTAYNDSYFNVNYVRVTK